MKYWSTKEIMYLHASVETKSTKEIAEHLGRSTASVASKMHREGLYHTEKIDWTEMLDLTLINNRYLLSPQQLAKMLNFSERAVNKRRKQLGLTI